MTRSQMTRFRIYIGYLGQDPQIRHTRVRTVTTRRYNRVSETVETREFETRPRPYILLSLATHAQPGGPPTWHRLVVWNGDLLCHRNIRFLGKGDKIKVRARPETYRFEIAPGQHKLLHQLVVDRIRTLKRRHLPPEVP
jgi:single-stranded DNA-binding protein